MIRIKTEMVTPWLSRPHHNRVNSAVKAGLDLLRGGIGNAELRCDFLEGTLFEHDGPIDALRLFRNGRLRKDMFNCRLSHGNLSRGIHERSGIAVLKRCLIPNRICRAVQRRQPGLLGTIAVNKKPSCCRGKVIPEPALRPVYTPIPQHLGQTNENILDGILHIRCG